MHDIVSLESYNTALLDAVPAQIKKINEQRIADGYTSTDSYVITQLHARIQETIKTFVTNNFPQIERVDCQIHWIDRVMFHADMTIKFDTSIVRTLGKDFASVFVPQVVTLLKDKTTSLQLTTIEQKGIYINCTLEESFWGNLWEQILSLGNNYGDLDIYKGQIAIAEYSSPNAAKHLHAGHVRSTVIGYVLSNIYEHAGYSVHRRNHINDRGGFGQLIEGWKRWHDILFAQWFRDNDLNYQIYTIFRQAEWCAKQRDEVIADGLNIYFPHNTQDEFNTQFETFKQAATQTFLALEAWDTDAFSIWQNIVASSMVEFQHFYEKLWITHDFTIGESFYERIGRDIIKKEERNRGKSKEIERNEQKWTYLQSIGWNDCNDKKTWSLVLHKSDKGTTQNVSQHSQDFVFWECNYEPCEAPKNGQQIITLFTSEIAEQYIQAFDQANPDLENLIRQKKHEEIRADINAQVVLLDNRERFVVLRSDGGSIYATRDIGCLRLRTKLWNPALIMYEVGQEQADHFEKLFETAEKLGWLDRDDWSKTVFKHIAHGFYVDNTTKKKLSSRAGASNVHALIDASIDYFRKKYDGNTEFSSNEIEHNARTLGVASIIINDIAKSRMDPVLVDPDLEKTIQWFEQSWGAYLLYTICRAKSLLKKATVERSQTFDTQKTITRTNEQIALLQQLSSLPNMLQKAVETHEPCVLVQYVYILTQAFNTLYGATDRMIDDPVALSLTDCYIQVASNVLRICNIEPLERM
jgi:arginyl-tRNA synthetase